MSHNRVLIAAPPLRPSASERRSKGFRALVSSHFVRRFVLDRPAASPALFLGEYFHVEYRPPRSTKSTEASNTAASITSITAASITSITAASILPFKGLLAILLP